MFTEVDGIATRLPLISALREKLPTVPKTPGHPLYVYEPEEAVRNLRAFREAFSTAKVPLKTYYAVKSNSYDGLLSTLVSEGCGLDVSSVRELEKAKQAGATDIIFTGPAKTEKEIKAILSYEGITVNVESQRELRLLSQMATEQKRKVPCGVRVQTGHQTGWTKFGIPLTDLAEFFAVSEQCSGVDLQGIHFHISMNESPTDYTDALMAITEYAKSHLSQEQRDQIQFLDIGGGFYPDAFDGIPTWNPEQIQDFTAQEEHLEAIFSGMYPKAYLPMTSIPITEYAEALAQLFQSHIAPVFPHAKLYAEPGRFIAHSCMHILLTLVDLKDAQRGVADGGTNMIGWEKYQYFTYSPMFNLTHFSGEREIPFLLYGNLCTPDDVWGYYLYCSDIQEGDTIALPYQGAYTHTLAQEFIQGVPDVIHLP